MHVRVLGGVSWTCLPAPIQAHDQDTLNYPVHYSFKSGTEGYSEFFSIDPTSGEITQNQPISRAVYRENDNYRVGRLITHLSACCPFKRKHF